MVSLSIKIAQKPFYTGAFGLNSLKKYESFEGKGKGSFKGSFKWFF